MKLFKTLKRSCLVCGKKFRTNIRFDRSYDNGHYFGKMKVPIGKGEHKKVGKFKMGRKIYDVVKWTGKEKEVEYWECNSCFEEATHECWLEERLEKLFGKRCKDYEHGCGCCEAWGVYDTIREFKKD